MPFLRTVRFNWDIWELAGLATPVMKASAFILAALKERLMRCESLYGTVLNLPFSHVWHVESVLNQLHQQDDISWNVDNILPDALPPLISWENILVPFFYFFGLNHPKKRTAHAPFWTRGDGTVQLWLWGKLGSKQGRVRSEFMLTGTLGPSSGNPAQWMSVPGLITPESHPRRACSIHMPLYHKAG